MLGWRSLRDKMRQSHFGKDGLQVLRVAKLHHGSDFGLHRFVFDPLGDLVSFERGSDARNPVMVSLCHLPLRVD